MLKLRTAPNKRNWFLRDWQLYFMLLLPIAYYILFKYMPMYGTLIAFKKFSAKKGIWGSTWVGFKNFEKFLSDPYFYKLVRLCSKNSVNATSVTKSEISRFRSRRPLPPDPYCSAPTQPPPLAAAWPWQVIGKNAKLNRRRDTFVSEISEFRHRRRD